MAFYMTLTAIGGLLIYAVIHLFIGVVDDFNQGRNVHENSKLCLNKTDPLVLSISYPINFKACPQ